MKFLSLNLLLAAGMIFLSCNQNNSSEKALVKLSENISEEKTPGQTVDNIGLFNADSTHIPQQADEKDKQISPKPPQQQAKVDWDKKIIKTATLTAEVKDYTVFYVALREKVKNLGGYIAQEDQLQSDYKIENNLVIKVPVDQFDNAMLQLAANTEKINEKKISSQDVTTEIIDTKSRMEAKKKVRLRYMDLLKQAKNMEEILQVEGEINGVQEQIESAAGRINYLGHATTFSTINFTYYQVLNVSAKNDSKPSFTDRLSSSFKAGGSWVGDLFVGLITVWPLFLAIFIGIFFYKKMRTQKPAQQQIKS